MAQFTKQKAQYAVLKSANDAVWTAVQAQSKLFQTKIGAVQTELTQFIQDLIYSICMRPSL